MELLVVTLAYTTPGRDADVLACIRQISDTIRNAPGLVTSSLYRSRGNDSSYLLLTTWEDEENWRMAYERYNPKRLLLEGSADLLTAPPEQWLMHYLWGYSRPTAIPAVAAAHMATIRPDQVDLAQKNWIAQLRQQATQSTLAFAFLARGAHEEAILAKTSTTSTTQSTHSCLHGSVLLNLLNWANEAEREEFYTDPSHQTISQCLSNTGVIRLLPLEPMS